MQAVLLRPNVRAPVGRTARELGPGGIETALLTDSEEPVNRPAASAGAEARRPAHDLPWNLERRAVRDRASQRIDGAEHARGVELIEDVGARGDRGRQHRADA
jgi:hypothetical protein